MDVTSRHYRWLAVGFALLALGFFLAGPLLGPWDEPTTGISFALGGVVFALIALSLQQMSRPRTQWRGVAILLASGAVASLVLIVRDGLSFGLGALLAACTGGLVYALRSR